MEPEKQETMQVKVIKSEPLPNQDAIGSLIGLVFNVIGTPDEEDGSVSVNSPEWGGIICLNKTEYEEVV